jgi:hypothetical protein
MQHVTKLSNFTPVKKRSASFEEPSEQEISAVRVQSYVCWLLLLPFGGFLILMMMLQGYRIRNIRESRAAFKKIVAENQGRPLLLCSNHLTFIDSALIIWGLASNWWFVRNYKVFPWNLPAGDFFKKKLKYHLTLYLTKCIFIHRDGTGEHKNAILGLCRFLLKRGHTVLVFPEGQRSRKGYFDAENITLGAGRLVSSLENPRVLCLHLRSDKQTSFSNYPPRDAKFTLSMRVIEPATEKPGKEGYIDISRQIAGTIKQMETEFFAANGISERG